MKIDGSQGALGSKWVVLSVPLPVLVISPAKTARSTTDNRGCFFLFGAPKPLFSLDPLHFLSQM